MKSFWILMEVTVAFIFYGAGFGALAAVVYTKSKRRRWVVFVYLFISVFLSGDYVKDTALERLIDVGVLLYFIPVIFFLISLGMALKWFLIDITKYDKSYKIDARAEK